MSSMTNTSGRSGEREGDRWKSVPPLASSEARNEEGWTSPIPIAGLRQLATEKQSVPVKAALAALRIYKVYLSVLFAGSCRFEPTCSMYMYEAIERFGVRRGSWMGMKRLLRCQPLSRKFGYDPVPEKTEAAEIEAGGSEHQVGRAGVTGREAHS
jgi:uncharacterized protein